MTLAYLGIGSNLERKRHIQAAYQALQQLGQVRPSKVYACAAVGFQSHEFYNLVIELETELELSQLKQTLRDIETKLGRPEDAKKLQPRCIDIDILLYGDYVSNRDPCLPRPDIFNYEFVILPLYELCPQTLVPNDGRSIAQIWQAFSPKGSLTQVEFEWH